MKISKKKSINGNKFKFKDLNKSLVFTLVFVTSILLSIIFGIGDSGEVKEFDVVINKLGFEHNISAKVGDTLRLKVTSSDVTHGIFISGYDINERISPGQVKIIKFKVTKPGKVRLTCSVMCGPGHLSMGGYFMVDDK